MMMYLVVSMVVIHFWVFFYHVHKLNVKHSQEALDKHRV